jgi:hypothetical protein
MTTAAYRAAVYLNTGRWQKAADAALRLHLLDASESLVAGLALFELHRYHDAISSLLHGALNYPRAARILAGLKTAGPTSYDEARDHNTGVHLSRDLHEYLHGSRRRARTFLKRLLKDTHAAALLDEIQDVKKRWHEQHRTDERDAFDRMKHMKSPQFARQEGEKLLDFVEV